MRTRIRVIAFFQWAKRQGRPSDTCSDKLQARESVRNRKSTGRFASSAGFPPLQNVGHYDLRTIGCEVSVDTITDTTC